MREIRNLYRFIPFGKFSLSGRGKPPFNQVFVGRQKERANFIELLTHQESFGAFLIAGQRGAGKTSFVDYCLEEYERMAYQRSIRISRASATSGPILLFVFALLAVSAFVFLTQGLELGAQNVLEAIVSESAASGDPIKAVASSAVIWVAPLFLFGSLLMLIPMLYALRAVSAISAYSRYVFWPFSWRVLASFVLAMPLLLWLAVTWGHKNVAPLEGAAIHLDAILYAYLWVVMPLYAMVEFSHYLGRKFKTTLTFGRRAIWVAVGFSIVSGVLALLNWADEESGADLSDLVLMMALFGSFVAGISRSFQTGSRRVLAGVLIISSALLLFCLIVFQIELGAASRELATEFNQGGALALLPCFYGGIFWLWALFSSRKRADGLGQEASQGAAPGPFKTVLLLKSSLFILLGFVGFLPLLRVLITWAGILGVTYSNKILDALPVLTQSHASSITVALLILLLGAIYATEYVWICRDFRSYRQDAAIGLLGRSESHPIVHRAWDHARAVDDTEVYPRKLWQLILRANPIAARTDKERRASYAARKYGPPRQGFLNARSGPRNHPMAALDPDAQYPDYKDSRLSGNRRYVFRQLEYATLPHFVYSATNPVLCVWINLGFDNLEHSRIIEAMLRRLRGIYQGRFLSLGSPIGFLNAFLLLATTVLFTSLVSKSMFHIGNINAMDRPGGFKYRFEDAEVSTLPKFGETNYCGFFEVYPEIAPNVKSLVCALPFNNAIMELLYSPVLQIHSDFESSVSPLKKDFPWKTPSGAETASKSGSEPDGCIASNGLDEDTGKPLVQRSWHKCLERFTPSNSTGQTATSATDDWGVTVAHFSADRNELDTARHSLLKATRNLREGLIDTLVPFGSGWLSDRERSSTQDPKPNRPFDRPSELVGDSELASLLLDQNFGLPRIAFETPKSDAKEDRDPATVIERGDEWLVAYSPYPATSSGPPTLRIYHIALYALGFWLMFTLNKRLRILPYRANLDAINELILLINGRETLRTGDKEIGGWMGWLMPLRRNERMVETASDPRVVEQRLIELLQRLRPYQPSYRSGIPNPFEVRPEITFVFDEMDKLSGIVDPELTKDAAGQTQLEENSRERARSLQLHQLLSDMKRLISGNAARFIFIGGRLYHDEWLADQAQRAPILNAIFNGQIYLPSLMADRAHPYGRFNDRVTELVTLMYSNARHRLTNWSDVRHAGAFSGQSNTENATYVQFEMPYSSHPRRLTALAHNTGMRVIDGGGTNYNVAAGRHFQTHKTGVPQPYDASAPYMSLGEQETFEQFINFLTYRSAGNPKKLKELIQSLVQTSSMALALPRYPHETQQRIRWSDLRHEGHDFLTLNDNAIYRMQFIDMLYRHLGDHLEGRMLDRDDKVSMSIFYLMDFLMKFHNRGFSRTNLQRVDELSHIHRAPDLRSVMGLLVQVSSERFLHRVLNGVYSFRFRSDFAREIDYLSRISKEEMAALNFTLDESQSLKGLYQQTINTGERENIDTVAGLGELYEYDQEYEIARNYYRRAISMLDQVQMATVQSRSIVRMARRNEEEDLDWDQFKGATDSGYSELYLLGDIMMSSNTQQTKRMLLSQIHWIVARVRLMLQVGQTYEQEMNFERANATYSHTAQLCDRVFDAIVQDAAGAPSEDGESEDAQNPDNDPLFKVDRVKKDIDVNSFPILFQAGIAAAWVQEKDPENIDQSVTYAENWIQSIYEREPILQRPLPSKAESYSRFQHTSGGIMIQVSLSHDRIGDLYFMKGRQSFKTTKIARIAHYVRRMKQGITQSVDPKGDAAPNMFERDDVALSRRAGYLDRAHYHYAAALWLLRKFLTHRYMISKVTWSWGDDVDPLDPMGLAPSHFHSTFADVVTDLSEVIFAKRSSLATGARMMQPEENAVFPGEEIKLGELKAFQAFRRSLMNESVDAFAGGFLKDVAGFSDEGPSTDRPWKYWTGRRASALIAPFNAAAAKEIDTKQRLLALWKAAFQPADDADDTGDQNCLAHFLQGTGANIGASTGADAAEGQQSDGYGTETQLEENTLDMWLGKRSIEAAMPLGTEKNPGFDQRLLEIDAPGGPFRHLEAYHFFSQAAARASQRVGQSTNAANEFLLQTEALVSTLWEPRILKFVKDQKLESWTGFKTFFDIVEGKDGENEDKDPLGDICDLNSSRIGLAAYSSLKDAVERIQFSERPSITRTSMNHGNPSKMFGRQSQGEKSSAWLVTLRDETKTRQTELKIAEEQLKAAKGPSTPQDERLVLKNAVFQARAKLAESQRALEAARKIEANAKREVTADYDLSQAFRDDPRPITNACSIILALTHKDAGPIGIGVAVLVYRDILCKIAGNTFDVRLDCDVPQADLLRKVLDKGEVPNWMAHPDDDFDPAELKRQLFMHTFAGLKTTLERFRFPMLNRLQGLKVLSDALTLDELTSHSFKDTFGTTRHSETGRLLREMLATAEIYGSEMHFPASSLGVSSALVFLWMYKQDLHVLYDDLTGDGTFDDPKGASSDHDPFADLDPRAEYNKYFDGEHANGAHPRYRPWLSQAIMTRESIGEMAMSKLNRAQQTCSMGDAYYENVAYLHTLNDDFNDRSIHFTHARNMALSDMTEVLALMVKSGFK